MSAHASGEWVGKCNAREPGLGYPCAREPGHLAQGIPHATLSGRTWTDPATRDPITEERLKEIEGRAAECVRNAQEASPGVWTDSETVAGEDVPALVAEVRRLAPLVDARKREMGAQINRLHGALAGIARITTDPEVRRRVAVALGEPGPPGP